MKSFKISAVIFLCSIAFLDNIYAQSQDYVITVAWDTIICNISHPTFSQFPKYKTADMRKAKDIYLGAIKEYYLAKENILYRKVYTKAGKPFFCEYMSVVEKGKVNLYEKFKTIPRPNATADELIEWYVAKGTDTVKLLKSSDHTLGAIFIKSREKRKNDFIEMISDNKEVYDKFLANDDLSFDKIRNLIHLYNTGEPLKN
ncbi:MAG TPA: hypothetical protein VGI43_04660 [Mucilaginibacter sp.]|jgi:hypothetical protein